MEKSNMNAQHTPTPLWTRKFLALGKRGARMGGAQVMDGERIVIESMAQSDADPMFRAMYAHDDLVAKLTLACGVLAQYKAGEVSQAALDDLAERLDSALAKAGAA